MQNITKATSLPSKKGVCTSSKNAHSARTQQRFRRKPLAHAVASALAAFGIGMFGMTASAAPQGGNVVAGTASIQQTSATRTDIIQQSQRAVVNWNSFNIGANEHVNFQQPSASAATLNRVTGGNVSNILGRMTANGQVYLVNPNGVYFGKNAKIDVGGLVASTTNIGNKDFMAGKLNFDEVLNRNGRIVNEGEISVADGGLVAFVAPSVENAGVIQARLGRVVLASGERFTLDLYGDDLISLAVPEEVVDQLTTADGQPVTALVSQSGKIDAEGGSVLLTASAARQLVDHVINMDGVITANSASQQNGVIVLSGGDVGAVSVAGILDASGDDAGETGGSIQVLGEHVTLAGGANIDVSGDSGGGTALIGGDYQGKGETPTATSTTVAANASINANANTIGDGGKVIVWADDVTVFEGSISGKGGVEGGDGGFAEVSGKQNLVFNGEAKLSASNGAAGTLLLDPDVTVVDGGTDGLSGSNIDASTIVNTLAGGTNVSISAATNVIIKEAIDTLFTGNPVPRADLSLTAQSGDVSINQPISLQGKLTATAGNNVTVGADIIAADGVTLTSTNGMINLHANVFTNNNNITFNGDILYEPKHAESEESEIGFSNDISTGPGVYNYNNVKVDNVVYQSTISTGDGSGDIHFNGSIKPSIPLTTEDKKPTGAPIHVNNGLNVTFSLTDDGSGSYIPITRTYNIFNDPDEKKPFTAYVSAKPKFEYVGLDLNAGSGNITFDKGLATDSVDLSLLASQLPAVIAEKIDRMERIVEPPAKGNVRSAFLIDNSFTSVKLYGEFGYLGDSSGSSGVPIVFPTTDILLRIQAKNVNVAENKKLIVGSLTFPDLLSADPKQILGDADSEVQEYKKGIIGSSTLFTDNSNGENIIVEVTGLIKSINIGSDAFSSSPSTPSVKSGTSPNFPAPGPKPNPPPSNTLSNNPPPSGTEDPGGNVSSSDNDNNGNDVLSGGQGIGQDADLGQKSSKDGATQDVFQTASHVVEGGDGSEDNKYLSSDPFSWADNSPDSEDDDEGESK